MGNIDPKDPEQIRDYLNAGFEAWDRQAVGAVLAKDWSKAADAAARAQGFVDMHQSLFGYAPATNGAWEDVAGILSVEQAETPDRQPVFGRHWSLVVGGFVGAVVGSLSYLQWVA